MNHSSVPAHSLIPKRRAVAEQLVSLQNKIRKNVHPDFTSSELPPFLRLYKTVHNHIIQFLAYGDASQLFVVNRLTFWKIIEWDGLRHVDTAVLANQLLRESIKWHLVESLVVGDDCPNIMKYREISTIRLAKLSHLDINHMLPRMKYFLPSKVKEITLTSLCLRLRETTSRCIPEHSYTFPAVSTLDLRIQHSEPCGRTGLPPGQWPSPPECIQQLLAHSVFPSLTRLSVTIDITIDQPLTLMWTGLRDLKNLSTAEIHIDSITPHWDDYHGSDTSWMGKFRSFRTAGDIAIHIPPLQLLQHLVVKSSLPILPLSAVVFEKGANCPSLVSLVLCGIESVVFPRDDQDVFAPALKHLRLHKGMHHLIRLLKGQTHRLDSLIVDDPPFMKDNGPMIDSQFYDLAHDTLTRVFFFTRSMRIIPTFLALKSIEQVWIMDENHHDYWDECDTVSSSLSAIKLFSGIGHHSIRQPRPKWLPESVQWAPARLNDRELYDFTALYELDSLHEKAGRLHLK